MLSERIGHSSVAFTMQTYVQRSGDLERDAAATAIADLILNREETATEETDERAVKSTATP